MKRESEKRAHRAPSRFVLKKETLRKLRPADLEAAVGGGDGGGEQVRDTIRNPN